MSERVECANCGAEIGQGEGVLMMTPSKRGYGVCRGCSTIPDLREGDLRPDAKPVIEL